MQIILEDECATIDMTYNAQKLQESHSESLACQGKGFFETAVEILVLKEEDRIFFHIMQSKAAKMLAEKLMKILYSTFYYLNKVL